MSTVDTVIAEPTYESRGQLIVSVEGNIGSGKSTFLSYCSQDPAFDVFSEPVDTWSNVGGTNLLEQFYSDPAKWGFPFQMEVMITLLDRYLRISPRRIKLVERSLLSARHCFQRCMLAHGHLDSVSSAILNQFHDTVRDQWRAIPQIIVYLSASPAVSYSRLLSRARSEESGVTLEYLSELDQYHDEWLSGLQARNMAEEEDLPILTINADRPFNEVVKDYDRVMKELKFLYDC
ncbi:deoxynucleoside kinase-like isoform X2 [Bradysia coprophila]|uniref:deoxynucleoside kinase-like isoform X2 n=1 Tax=Bradysia coprophila TaxID=38358 RepID=UPI00187D9E66|nr:deoxynucleoside kinase-like isoform X2 [Bradysia coprophila]